MPCTVAVMTEWPSARVRPLHSAAVSLPEQTNSSGEQHTAANYHSSHHNTQSSTAFSIKTVNKLQQTKNKR